MNSLAPRCSDALSLRSVPDCMMPPAGAAASAENDSRKPPSTAATRAWKVLVMCNHPFRHWLGAVEPGPQRHGDEEGEVVEGQEPADDGLGRVGAGAGADLAQPHEAQREQAQQHLGEHAAVAVGLDLGAIQI